MTDFRTQIRERLDRLLTCGQTELDQTLRETVTEASVWDVAHPVNRLTGSAEIAEEFLRPLRAAISRVHRRDEIFISGTNTRANGGQWIAALTHYVGTFSAPLFGLKPSNRLSFLRSGEFYRLEGDRIAEAKIIFDLPDLARQAGRLPFPDELGVEMLFPGPATHDGVCPKTGDGSAALAVVEAMLSDLHVFDPETGASPGQTGADGAWHEQMLWYGPGGVGSTYMWDGFVRDHRSDFLGAFPDRKGGNHFCRIGDGNYAAVSGWPSMTMTHQGPYLGVPPTGKALKLRVMDFYRCENGQIRENWVCLDYGDLFDQMGIDLIARSNALAP